MFAVLRIAVPAALFLGASAMKLRKEWQKRRQRKAQVASGECPLCHHELCGDLESLKCCGAKLHIECLRAFVQSLDGLPSKITCPLPYCHKVINFHDMALGELLPISPSELYFCHHCELVIKNGSPLVLPCTHRFCDGCIKECLIATAVFMGEGRKCPMDGCGRLIPDALYESIMRAEVPPPCSG